MPSQQFKPIELVQSVAYKKIYLLLGVLIVILFFGHDLLLFAAHMMHVLLEFIASILEHFLQVAFNLTERQAQIALFYITMPVVGYLSWRLSKKAYVAGKNACHKAHCTAKQTMKETNWLKATLLLTALGASFYLFT